MHPGRARSALTVLGLLLLVPLAGCLDGDRSSRADDDPFYPPITGRHLIDWNESLDFAQLLTPGPHHTLEVQEATFTVDTSDVWETGPASAEVHLSYWLPSNTLDGETVPVIAVVSPYYSYGQPGGSPATNVIGAGRGEFLHHNFVPHGYALAQVAVFGTEESTGCFDYRGHGEQHGIDAAVTWLGTQDWSNGNVGLYGKSYEGATQWEAAVVTNPHLKTIVPISGTTGLFELNFKNGSAESRAPIIHGSYFSSTVDGDLADLDNVCPDITQGAVAGSLQWIGGELSPEQGVYYAERSFMGRAFDNYEGSVYWIQGLHDTNVDSHQVFPYYDEFREAGKPVRGMFGQWGHDYPDQVTKHDDIADSHGGTAFPAMTRWDWAQDLFEWFEWYLQERGPEPEHHVQIQRNDGAWRLEETWPPNDAQWLDLGLGSDVVNEGGVTIGGPFGGQTSLVWDGATPAAGWGPAGAAGWVGDGQDLHLSGLVRFHVDVTTTSNAGQLFAELQDATTGLRLGHAVMDVRYHEGGYEPTGVNAGERVTMLMEFFGIDAVVPAGNGLRIVISDAGEEYLPPAQNAPLTLHIENPGVLSLPLIHAEHGTPLPMADWDPNER